MPLYFLPTQGPKANPTRQSSETRLPHAPDHACPTENYFLRISVPSGQPGSTGATPTSIGVTSLHSTINVGRRGFPLTTHPYPPLSLKISRSIRPDARSARLPHAPDNACPPENCFLRIFVPSEQPRIACAKRGQASLLTHYPIERLSPWSGPCSSQTGHIPPLKEQTEKLTAPLLPATKARKGRHNG
jgi:hypothetical protein